MDESTVRTNTNSLELEESLSLWSIVGQQRIIELLKNVVLSYFHDKEINRNPQFPSVLLAGPAGLGKKTIGKSLANSLGCTDYRECLARTLSMGGISFADYFVDPHDNTAFLVRGGEYMSKAAQELFYRLLTEQRISIPNRMTGKSDEIIFNKKPLVIFTIQEESWVLPELYSVIDFTLDLESYDEKEILLLIKQRCKWCGWKYSSDDVLKMIAQNADNNPAKSIKLFQISYSISRSQDRNILKIEDAQKAIELLGENRRKEE